MDIIETPEKWPALIRQSCGLDKAPNNEGDSAQKQGDIPGSIEGEASEMEINVVNNMEDEVKGQRSNKRAINETESKEGDSDDDLYRGNSKKLKQKTPSDAVPDMNVTYNFVIFFLTDLAALVCSHTYTNDESYTFSYYNKAPAVVKEEQAIENTKCRGLSSIFFIMITLY